MIYRVFLDTNIYDGANYSFRNAQFNRLVTLSKVNQLNVVINSVIEGEVRSHIKENVRKAVDDLYKATKNRLLAGFRNAQDFKDKLLIPDVEDWIHFTQHEFTEFLSSCAVRRISLNGIDVEAVMNDYFQKNPPFEQKKPEEFKDAIAIKSLVLDMKEAWHEPDTIQYCVISADKGFVSAVKEAIMGVEIEDYTILFNSLTEFTDYLAELDKQMQFMLRYLKSEYGKDLLYDTGKEALESSSYEIESDDEIFDQEIIDIDIISIEPHAVSLTNTAGIPDIFETVLEGKANITVEYSYRDENKSFYDKETRTYLYAVSRTVSAMHEIIFNIPVSFIVSGCFAEDNEMEDEDDSVFDDKYMELDIIEEQRIDLTEDNRISYDVIEVSDDGTYDTCPECGRRIGIDNDGGNGFCINCAINH